MFDTTIRVLVVEAVDVVRFGLTTWLRIQPDMTVVGSTAHLDEALTACRSAQPTVIVTAATLPEIQGADLVSALRAANAEVDILVVNTPLDEASLTHASLKTAGAGSVLGPDSTLDEVGRQVRLLANNAAAVFA